MRQLQVCTEKQKLQLSLNKIDHPDKHLMQIRAPKAFALVRLAKQNKDISPYKNGVYLKSYHILFIKLHYITFFDI